VLQCVAVCCSVLQCVAVCCSVLQCVAVCCCGYAVCVQCGALCCGVLQCVLQCVTLCDSSSHTSRFVESWIQDRVHHKKRSFHVKKDPGKKAAQVSFLCLFGKVISHQQIFEIHTRNRHVCIKHTYMHIYTHMYTIGWLRLVALLETTGLFCKRAS